MTSFLIEDDEARKARRRAAVEAYQEGSGACYSYMNTSEEVAFMEADSGAPHWVPPTVTLHPGVVLAVFRDGSIVAKLAP